MKTFIQNSNLENKSIDEMDVDVVVKRWSDLGFLEGLSDERKRDCALKMEELAIYLLEGREETNGQFDTISFPILRRIIDSDDKDKHDRAMKTSPKELCTALQNYWRENEPKLKKEAEGRNVDVEAEICAGFADSF